MSVPRLFARELVSELSLAETRSLSAANINAGVDFVTETFHVQLAAFLQPAGVTAPPDADRIAPGHVLYWFLFFTGATTLTVHVEANYANGGTFRDITVGSPFVLPDPVAGGVGAARRLDILGAVWECRLHLFNTGGAAATNVELAYGMRAF